MAFYFEKDFFEDPELLELVQRVMEGNLTLHWWDAHTERVKVAPREPARGLTYDDCNVGTYGWDSLPDLLRGRTSMAARGSETWGRLPDLGYTINRKSDVWSPNVAALYEEAKSRRWAPAVDVPWAGLEAAPRPRAVEASVAQICTSLGEIALVGLEMPTRWVFWINQDFLEVKSFLCTQMIDHARHVEALRKRALAGGEGLKRASVALEQALKEVLWLEPYPAASAAMNVMVASDESTLLRFLAAHAPGEAERRIFLLMLQDESRRLAYGMGHVREHLAHQPRRAADLAEALDGVEHALLGILGAPELVGSLAVYAGGGDGREALDLGRARVARLTRLAIAEYLERRAHVGLGAGSGRLEATVERVLA